MIGKHIKVVQLSGAAGSGTFTVQNDTPNPGDTTYTDSASGNSFVVPKPIAASLGDEDNDTSITPVEGGGANGGDRLDFSVDGVIVGSVEILASGLVKWSFSDIVDPIIYRPTPQTTVQLTALIPNAVNGDIAFDSTLDYHVKFDGTSWVKLSDSSENFVTTNLTSTENRTHDFDNLMQIIGQGQKTILSTDDAGRTALTTLNQGVADFYVNNTTGVNNANNVGLRITNANGVSATVNLETTDPVTGKNVGLFLESEKVRLQTEAVDEGNATVGQVLALSTTDGEVEFVDLVDNEGLRASPVADNATLTALTARNYERRLVEADGKEYVFELGASSGTLADDAATGFWQEQIAEGLVTTYVDASVGVITETLAASTGAGNVRLFTNVDVTNTATLAVASGETLNGVTDGTFLFSNYSRDTQFRVDEVTGGWVVSVVGTSTEVEPNIIVSLEGVLPEFDMTDADDDYEPFDLTSLATDTVTAGYDVDISNNVIESGYSISPDGGVVLPEGDYKVRAYVTHPTLRSTASSSGSQQDVGQFQLALFQGVGNPSIGQINFSQAAAVGGANIVGANQIEEATVTGDFHIGANGANIYLGCRAAINGVNLETFTLKYLTIEKLEHKEVVLAGMVTPESLSDFYLRKSSPTTNSSFQTVNPSNVANYEELANAVGIVDLTSATVIDANNDFTVAASGITVNKNISKAKIVIKSNSKYANGGQFKAVAQLIINGVVMDYDALSEGNVNVDQTWDLIYKGSLLQGSVIDLRYGSQSGASTDDLEVHNVTVIIEELPSSTVVMPNALGVEDLTGVRQTVVDEAGIDLNQTTIPNDNALRTYINGFNTQEGDWITLYGDSGVVSGRAVVGGGATLQNWQTSARLGVSNNGADLQMRSVDGVGLTIQRLVIEREAPIKTVINTTDTPTNMNEIGVPLSATSTKEYTLQWNGTEIVNTLSYEYENTANGEFECNHLTGVLKQWGSFNGIGSDNDQTVTLPTSFANTNYSVVANSATAGQEYAVGTRADFTTSFTLNKNDDGSGATDYHWQAIGLKP